MRELTIHLDWKIRISPRLGLYGLAVFFLGSLASDTACENVTMTTYYPAPSGVYTQMITTSNTYLARDAGKVGVGTPRSTG